MTIRVSTLKNLINIPDYLVPDVRTTVILAFFSSTISLIGVVFGVAAFIKNKLYLEDGVYKADLFADL